MQRNFTKVLTSLAPLTLLFFAVCALELLTNRTLRPLLERPGEEPETLLVLINYLGLFSLYLLLALSGFVVVFAFRQILQATVGGSRVALLLAAAILGLLVASSIVQTLTSLPASGDAVHCVLYVLAPLVSTIVVLVARASLPLAWVCFVWTVTAAAEVLVVYVNYQVDSGDWTWEALLTAKNIKNYVMFFGGLSVPFFCVHRLRDLAHPFPWVLGATFAAFALVFVKHDIRVPEIIGSQLGYYVSEELNQLSINPQWWFVPLFALGVAVGVSFSSRIAFRRVFGLALFCLFMIGPTISWPPLSAGAAAAVALLVVYAVMTGHEQRFRAALGPPVPPAILERYSSLLGRKLGAHSLSGSGGDFRVVLDERPLEVRITHWDGAVVGVDIIVGKVNETALTLVATKLFSEENETSWKFTEACEPGLQRRLSETDLVGEVYRDESGGIVNRFTPGHDAGLREPVAVVELSFAHSVDVHQVLPFETYIRTVEAVREIKPHA